MVTPKDFSTFFNYILFFIIKGHYIAYATVLSTAIFVSFAIILVFLFPNFFHLLGKTGPPLMTKFLVTENFFEIITFSNDLIFI